MKKVYDFGKGVYKFLTKSSKKKGTSKVKKKVSPPKTTAIKGAKLVQRKAPTKADDMARASAFPKASKKLKDASPKNISKKAVKPKKSMARKIVERVSGPLLAGGAAYMMSKAGGGKDKKIIKDNSPSTKKNFGMGMVDSTPKAKVKQGPPKPPAKKKKRSNITNSSSYDAVFAQETRNKRLGIKPKKGVMTGPEMMKKKKDDGKAPMYESNGTKGKVKAQYKMGGGKMKMASYYSGGGTIFTGR